MTGSHLQIIYLPEHKHEHQDEDEMNEYGSFEIDKECSSCLFWVYRRMDTLKTSSLGVGKLESIQAPSWKDERDFIEDRRNTGCVLFFSRQQLRMGVRC